MVTARLPAPSFIGLAAHPVRWGLLTELARSDRHVLELTHRLGHPQALVSYHLGRLRDGGLVSSRRSAHDGRASYYRLDLQRCSDALAATGASLHPGLTLRRDAPALLRGRGRRVRVLFACTGNGARSQIAAALLQQRVGGRIEVVSGGSHPKPIHPHAVRVLAERGIDIGDRQSKPLSQFHGQHFDYIVTLCDKVREACPEFSTQAHAIHWSIADPSLADPSHATGARRQTYSVFRNLAGELGTRIEFLTALIHEQQEDATHHVRS